MDAHQSISWKTTDVNEAWKLFDEIYTRASEILEEARNELDKSCREAPDKALAQKDYNDGWALAWDNYVEFMQTAWGILENAWRASKEAKPE